MTGMTTVTAPAPLSEPLSGDVVADIAARAAAVPAGVYRWRGNLDFGDIYLEAPAGGNRGLSTTVMSTVRCDVTAGDARRRAAECFDFDGFRFRDQDDDESDEDYDAAYDAASTLRLQELTREAMLDQHGERRTVQQLAFWDEQAAIMRPVRDVPVFAVAPGVRDREDPAVYRADLAGIDNPVAVFLAHAKADVDALLADRHALLARISELENTPAPAASAAPGCLACVLDSVEVHTCGAPSERWLRGNRD